MTTEATKTEVGSYFISNYPPFSQWTAEQLPEIVSALHAPPADTPLGLYLHISFCRKRCKFCYFRVYTDKAAPDVETYVQALSHEIELVSKLPVMGGRPFRFVYFGGGTPSFLSAKQLTSLVDRLRKHVNWDQAEEVTFECEPGTLSEPKIHTLKELGVTRLSLGVENFSDAVLEENGRAHLSGEVYKSWKWIQDAAFANVNIDLIAGMVGETWENWQDCIRRTVDLSPDSVTIYQLELPFNTVYSKDILGNHIEIPVADWPTKRNWVSYAYDELQAAGYHVSSAYTLVKDPRKVNFSYRDNLWRGSDLLATGVASFGHVSGVHYQNKPEWGDYIGDLLERNQLPLARAMRPTKHQLLVREMILQLKKGWLDAAYFRNKFGAEVLADWKAEWQAYQNEGLLTIQGDRVELTRDGLLRADGLLPAFFEAEHQGVRYMSEPLVFMMGQFAAEFPTDRSYAKNHMWAQQQPSGLWRFGFTAYAVRLLQDVYFLDWTVDAGTLLKERQQLGAIESKKAESDLFSPVAGTLVEFNRELLKDPSAINVDKYGGGWLFELQSEGVNLLSPEQYLAHLAAVWEVTQRTIKGQLND